MTDITEYGDLMINAYLDEWARRKTDGLLEDGTRMFAVGVVIKQVLDTAYVSDATVRDKAFAMLDSLSLGDTLLRDKQFAVSEAVNLADLITVLTGIIKQVADNLGLSDVVAVGKTLLLGDQIQSADNAYVDKVLLISEQVSLVEVVEKTTVGEVKTRIFLIVGDLAIQLTG